MCRIFRKESFAKSISIDRDSFLYKVTRNLIHQTGDNGAFLRNMMGALELFGVPSEEYWPYKIDDFEKEPTAFCYSFAQNYLSITYYRLNPLGTTKELLLKLIKTNLIGGLPSMFGFIIYNSIEEASTTGMILIYLQMNV